MFSIRYKFSQFFISMFLLSFMLISGCTQKASVTGETINEAIFGFNDVELTAEQLNNIPYASLYARINGQAQIFMVLAFADINPSTGALQLKWLSSDRGMIVTENGRIIKTLNLPITNLKSVSAQQPAQPSQFDTSPHVWFANYAWNDAHNWVNPVTVTSKKLDEETLSSLIWEKNVSYWLESVYFSLTDQTMHNEYWVDSEGNVVKSKQWIAPDSLSIELEVLKPYAAN